MSDDEKAKNAHAFWRQIDDIKSTDVSPERTKAFSSEDDFNGLSVEILIEVGSYIVVAANLLSADTRRWNRDQAILGGHLVRLYKLISALLDQICQRRREITFIVSRLAFECIVNLRFLLAKTDRSNFDSYVRYSLRQERRLFEVIHKHIEERNGEILPVEDRMLRSIDRTMKASGVSISDLSKSQPKNWAEKNLHEKAEEVGLGKAYLGVFGGPSASVHGNWMDLLEFHLETHEDDESFSPNLRWRNPRPQIAQTVALLATDVVREYFVHVFGEPIDALEDRFDNLSNRILQAMESHEAFLIATNAN